MSSKQNKTKNTKKRSVKRTALLEVGAVLLLVVFVNIIGHYLFLRLDLTAEKRYTLSPATKELLRNVNETVIFRVYLDGEFPADYKRLQNETREMLVQFRAYNKNIEYEFFNPNDFDDPKEQQAFYQKLSRKNVQPAYVQVRNKNGVTQQIIIPAADVYYKGRETTVQLLQNQTYVSNEVALNNSIQNLEYALSNAIRTLSRKQQPSVGFTTGHGELEGAALYDIQSALYESYRIENVRLDNNINALTHHIKTADSSIVIANKFDVLVVPKPTEPFTDQEIYLLDQYVMHGGRVLWLVDPLNADLDSLSDQQQAMAVRYPLNLEELFFNYGVRINPDLIMDIRCRPIPMAVGYIGDQPQIDFRPWLYFPELVPTASHPIVRNLDLIKTDFVSSIDLIDNDVKKTVLLTTSEYSRQKYAPVLLDLNEAKVDVQQLDQRLFNKRNLPVAVLLEGSFRSVWHSRLAPEFKQIPEMGYVDACENNKMVFVSDGDLIRNRYSYKDNSVYPLGYDYYTRTMYANKQFLLNVIDYLAGEEDVLATRSRDVKLRKLDVLRTHDNRLRYQVVNVVLPLLILVVAVPVMLFVRRRRNERSLNSTQGKK